MEEREGVAMEEERGGDRPPSARAREGVAAGDGERAPLWPEMLGEGVGRTEGVRGTGKAVFPYLLLEMEFFACQSNLCAQCI
jgi:hypothetical protein